MKNNHFCQTWPSAAASLVLGGFSGSDGRCSPISDAIFGSVGEQGAGALQGRGTAQHGTAWHSTVAWPCPLPIYPWTWGVLFLSPPLSFSFFKGFLINFLFQWWDNEF